MRMSWQNLTSMVMAPEENGGASGAGSSILTSPQSGSGSEAGQGNANPGSGASANASTGDASANQNPQGDKAADWKTSLPKELQSDATLSRFGDVSALANGYINLQKLMSGEKIAIPGKSATDKDWKEVYSKLGLPESIDKYEIKAEESATLKKDFLDEFKKNAFENGILPKQAQKLVDWFASKNKVSEQEFIQQRQVQEQEGLAKLKESWGAEHDFNLSRAQTVVKKFADPELIDYLDKSRLGSDPQLIKLLSKIGADLLKEDEIVGESGAKVENPQTLQKELSVIMTNKDHPYFVKTHPQHKLAVEEVSAIHEKLAALRK